MQRISWSEELKNNSESIWKTFGSKSYLVDPCLVFGDIQLLVNIGGYLGLFIGLSLNDLFGYSWDLIVAAVSRRRNHKIGKFSA